VDEEDGEIGKPVDDDGNNKSPTPCCNEPRRPTLGPEDERSLNIHKKQKNR
jgi:hypothetical protein